MAKLSKRVMDGIDAIPGEEGWWESGGHAQFVRIGKIMRDHRMSDEKIVQVLQTAYYAVAAQYGD